MQPREQPRKLGAKGFRVPQVLPWRIPLALVRVPKFQSVSVAVGIWGFAAIIGIRVVLPVCVTFDLDQFSGGRVTLGLIPSFLP